MGSNGSSLRKDFVIGSPLNVKSNLWDSINHCQKFDSKDTKKCFGKEYLLFSKKFPPKCQLTTQYTNCQKSIQNLKLLRHPYILEYVHSIVSPTQIILITEDAKDLTSSLSFLSGFDVLTGVYHILEALVFLETKVGMRHNSLCIENIFVHKNCHWVLGGLEYAAKIEDSLSVPKTDIRGYGDILEVCFRIMIGVMSQTAKDCMEELIYKINNEEYLSFLQIQTDYKDAFNNNLVIIEKFLENLPLKSVEEKEEFFSSIVDDLKTIPNEIIGERLLQSFFSAYMWLEPLAHNGFYNHLFEVEENGGILNSVNYKKYLLPALLHEFKVYEIGRRTALLDYFDIYAKYIDSMTLKTILLPQVNIGLKDIHEEIVSRTYKALSTLVNIIGIEAVTNNKPKKIFADGRLKNLNVPLDNGHLSPKNEKKVNSGSESYIDEVENSIKTLDFEVNNKYYIKDDPPITNYNMPSLSNTTKNVLNIPNSSGTALKSDPVVDVNYFEDMEPVIEAGPTLDEILLRRAAAEGIVLNSENNADKIPSKFALSLHDVEDHSVGDAWLSDSEDLLENIRQNG
uniref:Protein kinase domain-containing protein n=1 Tax=Parastrongyloides trichosuri TaxID=131310 RepID=A0A0N4ZSW4_PARTI